MRLMKAGVAALATVVSLAACDGERELLAPVAGVQAAQGSNGSNGGNGQSIAYEIALVGSSYDADAGQTTFTYAVKSGSKPAISHWVLGLAPEATPTVVSSSDAATVVGTDPTTGLYGIKFDTGYGDDESRQVTLVLEGAWAAGEAKIAVKAGSGWVGGTAQGPVLSAAASATYVLSGVLFADFDRDGNAETGEVGVSGVDVTLSNGAVATTAADGSYRFESLESGDYTVAYVLPSGLKATTPVSADVALSADAAVDFGVVVDRVQLCGQPAAGNTIGFWKNNLSKAIAGKSGGTQVSAATLASYTTRIGAFGLAPFAGITMSQADGVLGATGSDVLVLLRKQLLAAEYNYANGAYIGGSELVTRLFLIEGEYVLQNAGGYTRAELTVLKDWYDAYNNTHGGALAGSTCGG